MAIGSVVKIESRFYSTDPCSRLQRTCCAHGQGLLPGSAAKRQGVPFRRNSNQLRGRAVTHKRANSSTSPCILKFAQLVRGARAAGSVGAFADTSIETVDAVDTEALQLPATGCTQANALEHTNAEMQRLSILMKGHLRDLIALTVSVHPSCLTQACLEFG